jgi:hypothetical protein
MELFNTFAACVVRWNIEHPELVNPEQAEGHPPICFNCKLEEGAPMPCEVMSLLCLDLDFIMPIMFGWMAAISRISVPKELSLSDGGRHIQEELMKQLGQHQNLSTLPTPNLS